jgi:hypothetical protein
VTISNLFEVPRSGALPPMGVIERNPTGMTAQPFIFDLINGVVLQVGVDPEADRRYVELLEAQQNAVTTAEGVPRHD